MSSDTVKVPIVKLSNDNYHEWLKHCQLNLNAASVNGHVAGQIVRPTTPTNQPDWDQKDARAQSIIFGSLCREYQTMVRDKITSKEMFDTVKTIFEDKSSSRQVALQTQLMNFKFDESKDLVQQFFEIQQIAKNLSDIGVTMQDQFVISKIISSLPLNARYQAFKESWASVPSSDQNLPTLLNRFKSMEQDRRTIKIMKNDANKNVNKAFFNQGGQNRPSSNKFKKMNDFKKKTKCHLCKEFGHWKRECPLNPNK